MPFGIIGKKTNPPEPVILEKAVARGDAESVVQNQVLSRNSHSLFGICINWRNIL